MAAIKDLWRALGRKMRSASDIEALQFRYRRAGVNRAFKAMREGEIPGAPLECRYSVPPEFDDPFPEFQMKTKLLILGLLATLLAGCIVVPAHPYAYRPAPRVYVY